MATKEKKQYTIQQGLSYAMRYCSQQERTKKEVRDKLLKNGLEIKDTDRVITQLVKEDYISEQRYADLYVRSKLHQSHWGRIKIRNMLISKQIPVNCITKAFTQIDEQEYRELLMNLLDKKIQNIKTTDAYQRTYRLRYFLSSHGFENDLIEEAFRERDLL